MGLTRREKRALRRIGSALRHSDPPLALLLTAFAEPAGVPGCRSRLVRLRFVLSLVRLRFVDSLVRPRFVLSLTAIARVANWVFWALVASLSCLDSAVYVSRTS
jgi:hypothetical protein